VFLSYVASGEKPLVVGSDLPSRKIDGISSLSIKPKILYEREKSQEKSCSLPLHLFSLYDFLQIGARYEKTNFPSKKRINKEAKVKLKILSFSVLNIA
jgi:hypothetical protein